VRSDLGAEPLHVADLVAGSDDALTRFPRAGLSRWNELDGYRHVVVDEGYVASRDYSETCVPICAEPSMGPVLIRRPRVIGHDVHGGLLGAVIADDHLMGEDAGPDAVKSTA
jgi:hypothetical protein